MKVRQTALRLCVEAHPKALRVVCSALLFCVLASGCRVKHGDSMLRASRAELDLGSIEKNGQTRAKFRLENRAGDSSLEGSIKTSCACLSVKPQTFTIEPRGSVEVEATVTTKNLKRGNHTNAILISSSDAVSPMISIPVLYVSAGYRTANIEPEEVFSPLVSDNTAQSHLHISTPEGAPEATLQRIDVGLDSIRALSPDLPCELGDDPIELKLEIARLSPQEHSISSVLTLQTLAEDGQEETIEVPIVVGFQAQLECYPAYVNLGRVKVGDCPQRELVVTQHTGTPMSLELALPEGLSARPAGPPDGATQRYHVRLSETQTLGYVGKTLTFARADGLAASVQVSAEVVNR
jgi:HYDIN/CFA65/VesB-like, Ig-like domain